MPPSRVTGPAAAVPRPLHDKEVIVAKKKNGARKPEKAKKAAKGPGEGRLLGALTRVVAVLFAASLLLEQAAVG